MITTTTLLKTTKTWLSAYIQLALEMLSIITHELYFFRYPGQLHLQIYELLVAMFTQIIVKLACTAVCSQTMQDGSVHCEMHSSHVSPTERAVCNSIGGL